LYALFGGLRTVAVSDTINGIGLLIGGFLIAWFSLLALGDGSISNGLTSLSQNHPQLLNSIGDADSSVPF
ncbi:MAG: solute:sodium symporter family transporter, partial [Gammaproteobacteria bacterium]|nr:solute:sodium symporter family transporter [Gammaproteobacteria bacterium]